MEISFRDYTWNCRKSLKARSLLTYMQGWGEDRTKGDISVEIKSLILCFDSIGGNMIDWLIDLIIQSLFLFFLILVLPHVVVLNQIHSKVTHQDKWLLKNLAWGNCFRNTNLQYLCSQVQKLTESHSTAVASAPDSLPDTLCSIKEKHKGNKVVALYVGCR